MDVAVGCHARVLTTLLPIVAAVTLATSCGPSTPTPTGATAATPLRLALETEFHGLDPADATDAVRRRLVSQLFDTLVDWDPLADPPRLVPELLEDLPTISADGLTYTLRIRKGPQAPRFHADTCLGGQDRPVVAADVAASLLRVDPHKHAAWALLAGRVAGLDAWHAAGRPPAAPIVADAAAGAVTLTLTRPQPEFTEILANPALSIVPPECAADPSFATRPVGSGPFRLDHDASEFPHTAVLVAAGAPRPYPPPPSGAAPCLAVPGASRVILSHFQHDEPALRAFQAGDLAALAPGQAQFAEVVAGGAPVPGALPEGTWLKKFPVAAVTYLVFNMRHPDIGHHADPARAAENRALRRAISLAFDVPRYLQVVRNGAWADARASVVPSGLPGAADLPDARPAPDLDAARRVLADAGLSERTFTLTYWCGVSEAERQEAALVREFLRPLGVDVQIAPRDNFLFDPGLAAGAHMFGLRFDADYLDAGNFLAPFTCAAPDNFSGHCDPAYDAAFAEFVALPPGPARDRAAAGLQARLAAEMPVRPIDQPSAWYLGQPWLAGLVRHPLAGLRVELLCRRP